MQAVSAAVERQQRALRQAQCARIGAATQIEIGIEARVGGNDDVVTVIAAEEEDADQRAVVSGGLGERLDEAELAEVRGRGHAHDGAALHEIASSSHRSSFSAAPGIAT